MIRLLSGDCRDVLPTLPAESVQCVVCSPPYYALRSYLDTSHPDKHREIGSEPTPDEYLATMVGVFREVRRVLRRDGTCWVNMGDSYAGNGSGSSWGSSDKSTLTTGSRNGAWAPGKTIGITVPRSSGAKPKDLLLMPARLALALQGDGWWVRSAIVWAKPNPMPESCRDRPTSAYEMVYLLTKRATYFYDADAVREPNETANPGNPGYRPCVQAGAVGSPNGVKYATPDDPHVNSGAPVKRLSASGRNMRNVWTIATHAYPEAHFATFPPELAERCIRAGTSERGCCAQCGAPWVRQQRQVQPSSWEARKAAGHVGGIGGSVKLQREHQIADYDCPEGGFGWTAKYETTGWSPGCQCGTTETRPCVVLDPFIGAGTTALVADRLQRDCIGIDLNTQYTRMAMDRCIADAPLFTSFPPAEPPEDTRMRDLFDMAAD